MGAVTEGNSQLDPARGRAQSDYRDRGGLEQIPAQPSRDGEVHRRIPESLDKSLVRCRECCVVWLSTGLDSHPWKTDREGSPQGFQTQGRWICLGESW